MDQFMPALPLKGVRVVVVGEAEAALNKLRLLRTAPCDLVWYSLDHTGPAPADLKPDTRIVTGRLPRNAFKGAKLAFIGTENSALAARLARRARRAGALVNVVDNLDLCDFYTPAIVDRGAVTIALSTGGAAPILARDIRSAMESVIPPGVGLLAEAAQGLRDAVKRVAPSVDQRRRFWEFALRGPAATLADSGDEPGTRRALVQALDAFREGEAREAGIVHLVGAGPGDPELLTVKAARLIRDADVIVHDRLVSAEVLDRARRDALRIDVGKTRGRHPVPQERICEILVEHASQGKRVVRLKGGDSFIFGRGGEEVEAVRAAGITVEVTPGISAALACAANTQIPLTHRDAAQAVTFVTGQPKAGGPELDYAALASAGHTVVIYMGVATAAATAERLIAAGRDASTPIAIVEKGSLPGERVITSTLARLGCEVESGHVTGPAVIIIGDVVRYAPAALSGLAAHVQRAAA